MKALRRNQAYLAAAIIAGPFVVYSLLEANCTINAAAKSTVFCRLAVLTQGAIPALGMIICLLIAAVASLIWVVTLVRDIDGPTKGGRWALSFFIAAVFIFFGRAIGSFLFVP